MDAEHSQYAVNPPKKSASASTSNFKFQTCKGRWGERGGERERERERERSPHQYRLFTGENSSVQSVDSHSC